MKHTDKPVGSKPVAYYSEVYTALVPLDVGYSVWLRLAKDHPKATQLKRWHNVRTSRIVRLHDDGLGFETQNTVYRDITAGELPGTKQSQATWLGAA